MIAAARNRFTQWLSPARPPVAGPVVLSRRRIYILPTRQGIMFAVVLLMMLLGSINYSLSLGFVLTFLLAGMAFNAMLHTVNNLARLAVSAGRARAVFAGEDARFIVHVANPDHNGRPAVGVSLTRRDQPGDDQTDIPAGHTAQLKLSVPTKQRGRFAPGRFTLYTRYPLGLYQAWSYVNLDMHCIVYPRPAPAGIPLPPAESAHGTGVSSGRGYDDFAGLRAYHVGDSPRHIAWKAVERGQGLLTKQFSGQSASEVWLTWNQLPARMNVEEKLSHLTRWVLDAHAQHIAWGLRLPGLEIGVNGSDAHRERCLEALALFDQDSNAAASRSTNG